MELMDELKTLKNMIIIEIIEARQHPLGNSLALTQTTTPPNYRN